MYVGTIVFNDGAYSISVPVKPLVAGCHHLPTVQILHQQHGGSLTYLLLKCLFLLTCGMHLSLFYLLQMFCHDNSE